MTDYSVINNVNVFVRLSGFIHPTSRRVLLKSSKRTNLILDHFLVFSRRRPLLRSDHATARIPPSLEMKQQTEINVSGSCCLSTTMRSSIHCTYLVGQVRRSACDIVEPRATARNATHTKTSQRNKAYTPLFFFILHIYIYIYTQNIRKYCI